MTDEQQIEVVTFITPETYVYSIPPLKSNKGHKASEWDVENPLWKGRLRVAEIEDPDTKNLSCELKLEDADSGELFAKAPYSSDGRGVEPVLDSSRFFAVRVVDGGKQAVLGMGFPDRSVAFEFNIALQNFKKHMSVDEEKESHEQETNKKDYSLKQGEKIHVNIGNEEDDEATSKKTTEPEQPISIPNLPPPPTTTKSESNNNRSDPFDDDFGDFVE